jgi:LysM repeat protein
MAEELNVLRRLATGILATVACVAPLLSPVWAQGQAAGKSGQETPAQLELRRTVKSREYQGKNVEGEERVIRPRDTLWRILIVEKGLPEKRFTRYVILIGELNPGLKRPDVLQVGETLFIPIQPDQALGMKAPAPAAAGTQVATASAKKFEGTQSYRVKPGDQLYKVLREQLGISGGAEVRKAVEQVKALNPGKKNWETLLAGEILRLPGGVATVEQPVVKPAEEPARIVGLDYGEKIPAQENLDLLESVMKVLGRETRREGEEVVTLREGTVHIDRGSYPVIQDARGQKVILDLQNKITAALRARMEADAPSLPVVSLKKGASLHEAVAGLLSRLGFQSLPSNQPVVVQDSGVAVQVKGEWMVTTPEAGGAVAQVMVISLTDAQGQTPDYLKDYLSLKGMNLKEILLPAANPLPAPIAPAGNKPAFRIEKWPADGVALVDAFLADYGIASRSGSQFSVMLRDGIRMEAKADRLFEHGGKKVALFFRPLGDEVKNALQQSEGLKVVEIDVAKASGRELIAYLLFAVGESASYREQRFQANDRGAKDKLTLAVPGYYLPQRSLLLTDREIPRGLERFFGEKGTRVIRFQ